jgi:hypothetical protein
LTAVVVLLLATFLGAALGAFLSSRSGSLSGLHHVVRLTALHLLESQDPPHGTAAVAGIVHDRVNELASVKANIRKAVEEYLL